MAVRKPAARSHTRAPRKVAVKAAAKVVRKPVPKRPAITIPAGISANSVVRALNVIGDRWILLILYRAFLGSHRFDDFQRTTGMARSLLADRLKRLERTGILQRTPYQKRPVRYEYRLTEKGADLHDAAMMIVRWEKRWHFDRKTPVHHLRHIACDHGFTPELRCKHCREIVTVRHVSLKAGPGAGSDRRLGPRAQRRSSLPARHAKHLPPMLERALEVLGDRWTSHVIAAAFYGKHRFNEFQETLQIATNLLADRLERVVKLGLLERTAYQARPKRYEYRLTESGRDLFPLVVELMRWGDRWLAGKGDHVSASHEHGSMR